jgi:flagellin
VAGVTFTGGSGSAGLTGTINYDASGNITTITTLGGTNAGFKAGDLLSASSATSLTTPTYSSRDGAGLMATGSTATIVARDVKAGDVVRIEGKTLTATQNATADQVASVFRAATNAAGTALGFGTLSGAYTGSLATATPTGANANIILTATGAAVTNATTFDITKTVSNIIVGQDVNFAGGSSTLTMSGTVNGIATTQSLAVSANAALATQKFNFDSFGIAFDVKSYQAQTANQLGASIATLNMGVGQSVAGGPGQVIVASGNNSALKFQSGANSDAYIQIDTVNIQTGNTGQYAGSQLEMTTLGRVITQSGAGNLGTLGLTDTIDTWQTAFKNSAAAVDNALEYISTQRAVYGSQANRLSYINTNLQAQSTNLQNSRSSIIDTDFAAETARLTKGQIMQQAATAMLAQANQMPNVILSLLK